MINDLDRDLEELVLRGQDYFELLTDSWAANFHASTALEGNPLSLEEVRKTTRRAAIEPSQVPINPFRQEIYQHVMILAADDIYVPPWTLNLVARLHSQLTRGLGAEYRPGVLRQDHERVQVGDTGSEGTVWFEGAPGIHVQKELEELLRWLNEEACLWHPLVAAAVFFHEFESIHPFEDGNGRAGRVLFHMYLQTHGMPNAHKCIIEPLLTGDPDLYYRLLGWTDHTGSYQEWVDFVVNAVLAAYQEALERYGSRNLLTQGVDENKRRLLVRAKRHNDWFTKAQASAWVEARSDATVASYLQYWIDQDVMEARGSTRDRRYRFRDPLRLLEDEMDRQVRELHATDAPA